MHNTQSTNTINVSPHWESQVHGDGQLLVQQVFGMGSIYIFAITLIKVNNLYFGKYTYIQDKWVTVKCCQ